MKTTCHKIWQQKKILKTTDRCVWVSSINIRNSYAWYAWPQSIIVSRHSKNEYKSCERSISKLTSVKPRLRSKPWFKEDKVAPTSKTINGYKFKLGRHYRWFRKPYWTQCYDYFLKTIMTAIINVILWFNSNWK